MIVANSYGLIDADYADNPDNEGLIYVQLINLSPVPQMIKKGENRRKDNSNPLHEAEASEKRAYIERICDSSR